MLSTSTRKLFALLFAPLFALCLATASGCEQGEVDGDGNGVEIEEERGLGENEVEIEED